MLLSCSVKLLKKDKNGSPESLNKLPQMAKQLEVSIYRNARSFEAYMDSSNLKARLQQVAVVPSRILSRIPSSRMQPMGANVAPVAGKYLENHYVTLANFNINYGLLREMPGIWSSHVCSASDSSCGAFSRKRKR